MDYNVTLQEVSARTIASVQGRAQLGAIADTLLPLLTRVWDYVRGNGISHSGQSVAIYHGDEAGQPCEGGILLEAGVTLNETFESDSEIVCSATPAGTVAYVLHIGPYNKLGDAHKAVRDWCSANGYKPTGVSWELYGHWTENVEELETEIFYLVDKK